MTTPDLRGDATEAAQKFLGEAIQEAEQARSTYDKHASARYYLALALKGVALFGGLIVATSYFNNVVLGFIISAAVLLDQLFSNYKRMMTDVVASAAVDRTVRKVKTNYNDQVLDVISANEQGDKKRARELLFTLARDSARTVRQELDRIKEAVAHANIQFLSSLNLDQTAKTELPHAPDVRSSPPPPLVPPALPEPPPDQKKPDEP
jgi:hypothetical protein